jgi:uncharacterized protein with beta-barrel porin domain
MSVGRGRLGLSLLASSSITALLASSAQAFACYSGPFAGGYTNSGATGCIVVSNTSFTGNLVNNGTVNPSGIAFVNGTMTGQLVDGGTILGGISLDGASKIINTGNAIDISGATFAGGISNSGTISTRGVGIFVQSVSTFSGGISNSSTIAGNTGISIDNVLTFAGGISNSGTISATGTTRAGIFVEGVSTFAGGISNSGTIFSPTRTRGVMVTAVSNFAGGISNSGAILAFGDGIFINDVLTFAGGISNSGTISGFAGIFVDNASTLSGGINNSGTISGDVGIAVTASGPVSIFDSGVIVGIGGTAVDLTRNAAGNTFTLGPGYAISGLVQGQGNDTFQLGGSGNGAFNLSNIGTQYTGFTTFNVVSGVWTVSGATGTAWTVAGGTLGGAATIGSVTVAGGSTFAPGTPGTAMTVNGSLTLQSAAIYIVTLNGASTSGANVSGAVSIANGARFAIANGSMPVANTTYTVLAANGGVTGTFANQDIYIGGAYEGVLSYLGDDVDLTVRYASLLPLLPPNAPVNVVNVANGIDTALQSGATPSAGFVNLFNLSPAQLQYALSQLSGEAGTGAAKGADQLMTDFLNLMLDPTAGGGSVSSGGTTGFAPEQDATLPAEIALAYARALKAPASSPASGSFDQRWTAWGSAFGGSSFTQGNAAIGSNNVAASDYGFAAGMEYRAASNFTYGFGIAGGGTNWNLAQGLGSGRSDSFQAGVYAKTHWGPAYVSAALAFANHWFTTNRIALGDQLQANFTGQSYAARLESGYRYAVPITGVIAGVTPYAALQAQDFHTPSYSETDLTGGGFALGYNSMNATDTRSELGARFDNLQIVDGMPLVLRGRLAWAHDWYTDATALNAVFETLPGSNFTVNGATAPKNSALTTAAAELHVNANWTAIAKFDGEFGSGSQTYGGTGTLRYNW